MNRRWHIGIIIAVFIVVFTLAIVTGNLNGWSFVGIIFYIVLGIGGYLFLISGIRQEQERIAAANAIKNKFDWCFERTNAILRRMPGGEGISWSKGFGFESKIRSYHDGIQNRKFRSLLGFFEHNQQLVLIIYDIHEDDIADIIANPDYDLLVDPFKGFRPFAKSGSMGGYEDYDDYGRPINVRGRSRAMRNTPINFNIGGQTASFEDLGARGNETTHADDDMVEDAVKKIKD